MTMTGTVRPMNAITAADIAVGQQWQHVVTEKARRRVWTIVSVAADRSTVRSPNVPVDEVVLFGALLSDWVLVAEA
jgi:hypothetical protein